MGVTLQENDLLGDRFRLEKLLGEGGMGTVWRAHDLRLGKPVALKFLRGTAHVEAMKRFFREARAAMAVRHPNVVQVHEICTGPDGAPLMVMDYLVGESLGDKLQRERKLPLGEVAPLMMQVVSAIGTAHSKGIVHRDIKPDNIFLLRVGPREEVRVLDFGIAKMTATSGDAMATAGLTSTGAVLGTPYYMSPEQVFADKTIDHRADIWSIGIVLYELLTGKKPLVGDSIGALLRAITDGRIVPLGDVEPSLPADLCELVGRMLQTDRDKRPSDLREVYTLLRKHDPSQQQVIPFGEATMDAAIALDDTLPGEPLKLSSTNDGIAHATQPPAPPKKGNGPLVAGLFAAVVVVTGGALGVAKLRAGSQPTETGIPGTSTSTTTMPSTSTSTSTTTSTSTSTATSAMPSTSTAIAPSVSASASQLAHNTPPKPPTSASAAHTITPPPTASAPATKTGIAGNADNPY